MSTQTWHPASPKNPLPVNTPVYSQQLPPNSSGIVVSVSSDGKKYEILEVKPPLATGAPKKFTIPCYAVFTRTEIDPYPAESAARPSATEADHRITTDEMVDQPDREARKTPSGLRQVLARDREKYFPGKAASYPVSEQVLSRDEKYEAFAQIVTDHAPVVDVNGVTMHLTIRCNLKHMAKPHDLVPVWLVLNDNDKHLNLVEVVTPTPENNICSFNVSYTWEELLRLLGDKEWNPQMGPAGEYVVRVYPHISFKAQWLTAKDQKGPNSVNHFSGGVFEKGGSGKIRLRQLGENELKSTESSRISEWNVCERLRPGRPVWDKHKGILFPATELATTLEAESEFIITENRYAQCLTNLIKLTTDKSGTLRRDYGILAVKGPKKASEKGPEEGSEKESGKKITYDTYYDLDGFPLLRNRIVLRRRHVTTDEANVFLLCTKGRTATTKDQKEKFRLAAQVHLLPSVDMTAPEVAAFCFDNSTDNAFGRIVYDALDYAQVKIVDINTVRLRQAFVLKSERTKYSFELDNGTTVELSLDEASMDGTQHKLFTIEVGVGHPGLLVAQSTGSGQSGMASWKANFTRPYHVPKDLDPDTLALKADFQQFQRLRDTLLPALLGCKLEELEPGGNKAHTLAMQSKLFS